MNATTKVRLVKVCGLWRNDEPGGLLLEYADPTAVAEIAAHIKQAVPWMLKGNTSDGDGFVDHLVQRLRNFAAVTKPLSPIDAMTAMAAIRCLEVTGALTPNEDNGLLYIYVAPPDAVRQLVQLHAPSKVKVIHPGDPS